jgi:ABC-type branched-subunit amino acid transport system substrate-binding protein
MVRRLRHYLFAPNPDIVYIGAYPPDNVSIIRAADEIGLSPKMMGGAMIGRSRARPAGRAGEAVHTDLVSPSA